MGEFYLSSRAAADLAEIADYTIETFGIEQARRYRDGLTSCFPTPDWVGYYQELCLDVLARLTA